MHEGKYCNHHLMGPYFRIQYIRVHRFWSWFLGHGIRQTSNSRCQTCESVLITHLGSNKYVSCFRRCRISRLLSKAAFTLATVMFVPVMLILVLVAVRSTFMVFAYSAKYQYLLRVISGITGLLIPALLITVLPVTEGLYYNV